MNRLIKTVMYAKNILSIIFLTIFLCVHNAGFPDETKHTGTLIVTYQTNQDGERLDRIRFWVKGSDYKQWLFPKNRSYVDDPETKTRKVVIEHLPEGQYMIEFLIPNTDGLYSETPARPVMITSGSVLKIEQLIKTKTQSNSQTDLPISLRSNEKKITQPEKYFSGALVVTYHSGSNQAILDNIRFSLTDDKGKRQVYPDGNNFIPAYDINGRIIVISDLPAGNYTVDFFQESNHGSIPLRRQIVTITEKTTQSLYESFAS